MAVASHFVSIFHETGTPLFEMNSGSIGPSCLRRRRGQTGPGQAGRLMDVPVLRVESAGGSELAII